MKRTVLMIAMTSAMAALALTGCGGGLDGPAEPEPEAGNGDGGDDAHNDDDNHGGQDDEHNDGMQSGDGDGDGDGDAGDGDGDGDDVPPGDGDGDGDGHGDGDGPGDGDGDGDAGDGDGDGDGPGDGDGDGGEDPSYNLIQIHADQLSTLRNGYHYEGWALIDGAPVSTGKFNVDASGAVVDLAGIAIADGIFDAGRDLSLATEIVITIEQAGDVDIVPSETHILAGSLDGSSPTVTLSVDGGTEAFGTDFLDASGRFILATPTNGPDSDEKSGLWWIDLTTEPVSPGLQLPTLPAGWAYEGWGVVDGVPVSTGRFLYTDQADNFDGFSGELGGPPFPGEDFLVNPPEGVDFPLDLLGGYAVITIEPHPDDSPEPFAFKPLVGEIAQNAADHQTLYMHNNADTFATATATLMMQ